MPFCSRAGDKLNHAIKTFNLNITDKICADFGSSTGGFVDCLLQNGAKKVFSVETGYGLLDWKLRNDERVIILERTNAMHITLSEKVDLLTSDTSWTKLENVLPNIILNTKVHCEIIILFKPHYEAKPHQLKKGKLDEQFLDEILEHARKNLSDYNLIILGEVESPIVGEKGKNREWLFYCRKINK